MICHFISSCRIRNSIFFYFFSKILFKPDQCDTQHVSPSIYDAVNIVSAIRHLYCGVSLCAVQEKHSKSWENKPGRPIRGLDWQEEEDNGSKISTENEKRTKYIHTRTQSCNPTAELQCRASFRVRKHRVPLPCNNCSTLWHKCLVWMTHTHIQ